MHISADLIPANLRIICMNGCLIIHFVLKPLTDILVCRTFFMIPYIIRIFTSIAVIEA